jgi:hypothetical protein
MLNCIEGAGRPASTFGNLRTAAHKARRAGWAGFGRIVIENALVFALGALSASLVALILFPIFMRRAARLARGEIEARLPRSLSEMAAAKDAVRAQYAVKAARIEADLAAVRKAFVDECQARAEETTELAAMRIQHRSDQEALALAESRVEVIRADLRQAEEALNRALSDRRDMERRVAAAERAALGAQERAGEAERIATEIGTVLISAEAGKPVPVPAMGLPGADELPSGDDDADSLQAALQSLLAERDALMEEASRLRRERDRLRLEAMRQGATISPEDVDGSPAHTSDDEASGGPPPRDADILATFPIGPDAPQLPQPFSQRASELPVDPEERAQRVDDLARRLKRLRSQNASARSRLETAE